MVALISDISNLFYYITWLEVYLLYWPFQRTSIWFLPFLLLILHFQFHSFSSHFSFFSSLDLISSYFPSFLRLKLWLQILELPSFLTYAFDVIHLPLSIAFAASHILITYIFPFKNISFPRCFKIFYDLIHVFFKVYCLISKYSLCRSEYLTYPPSVYWWAILHFYHDVFYFQHCL